MDLQMTDISKKIDSQHILNKVNLKINSGEVHWILGESKTGKTTLLRVLLNLYKPSEGYVYIDGVEAGERLFAENRKKMAYIPQGDLFYEDLTILENLLFYDGIYFPRSTMKERIRRIKWILSELELVGQGRKSIKYLSANTLSRMRLIQMLNFDHALVIIDEPYTQFDRQERAILNEGLRRFRERNTTVVLTSRLINDADFMAKDKRSLMKAGGIIE